MPKFKQAQIKMETCPNGHPRTQENQMNGKRYMCRACLEERVLAKRLYREFRKTGKRP